MFYAMPRVLTNVSVFVLFLNGELGEKLYFNQENKIVQYLHKDIMFLKCEITDGGTYFQYQSTVDLSFVSALEQFTIIQISMCS